MAVLSDQLNAALRTCVGLAMRPFERLSSPWAAILFFSFLLGLLAMLAYKYCSDQAALKREKNRLLARILEIQILRDDLLGIFGALGRVFVSTALYLKESLKPLAVLIVPILLLLIHLSLWFEYNPLRVGESVLVSAHVEDPTLQPELRLAVSSGLKVETDAFVSRANQEVLWRVRITGPADAAWLEIQRGDMGIRKSVATGKALQAVSPRRVGGSFWRSITNPGEKGLPTAAGIRELSISYPKRDLTIGTFHLHWVVAIFILSLVFGLLLKHPLRVDF